MKLPALALGLALAALLAGCATPDTPPAPSPGALETATLPVEPGDTEPSEPMLPPAHLDLSWSGSLGWGGYACGAAGCTPVLGTPGEANVFVETPAGRLRWTALTVTWQAATPATATLHLGIMVMDGCPDACVVTRLADVEGVSPLALDAQALDVPLNATSLLHAFVWAPALRSSIGESRAVATMDQEFAVEGAAHVERAPA